MARSVNKVILIGHLGKDPELSYLPSGQSVAKFTLATNYRHKDKSGEWKDGTDWHNIVAWGKLGEFCTQYLSKGRQAYVEGQLRTRNWEDREGKARTSIDIVANEVVPLGPRGEGMAEAPVRSATARVAQGDEGLADASSPEITDDDIPF
ncbi:MAG: single-stranded DNA-binding protein [Acidobacteria bacterium]|nr:single-stranded DNA-binding protein [Acidobacteriota bacterium]